MADGTSFASRFARDPNIANSKNAYRVTLICAERKIVVQAFLPEEFGFDVGSAYEAPFAQGLNDYMPGMGTIAKFFGVNLTTQAMTAQVWQGSSDIRFSLPLVFQAEQDSALEVIKPINDLLKLTMPSEAQAGGLLEAPGPRVNVNALTKNLGTVVTNVLPTPQQGGPTQGSSSQSLGSNIGSAISTQAKNIGAGVSGAVDSGVGVVKRLGEAFQSGGMTNLLTTVAAGTVTSLKQFGDTALSPISRALVNSIENNISLYIGNFLYFPSIVIEDVSQTYNTIIGPDDNPMRAQVNLSLKTFYVPTQNDLQTLFPAANRTLSQDNGRSGGAGIV